MPETNIPLLTFSLTSEEAKLEQQILQEYFNNPHEYIAPEDYERYWLPWGEALPNGLKITKGFITEESEEDEETESNQWQRFFILPGENAQNTVMVPFIHYHENDSGLHSSEIINGQVLFHQNANDLSKIQEEDSDSESDDTSQLSLEEQEALKRYNAFNQRCYQVKNYLNVGDSRLFKFTVKWLTTADNQRFVLKRRRLCPEEPCQPFEHCLSSLYLCDSFIRKGKRYEIMHDKGPTLDVFLALKRSLTDSQKDCIAECLLKELAHLQTQGIVLTDIKEKNICIKEHLDPLNPYILSYIDDSEAFRGANTAQGCGTVGYLAPEFFIEPPPLADFSAYQNWQEDLQINGTLDAHFKTDRRQLFCYATDTFALGCVLRRDLGLTEQSRFYALAQAMCSPDPSDRPDLISLFSALAVEPVVKGLKASLS